MEIRIGDVIMNDKLNPISAKQEEEETSQTGQMNFWGAQWAAPPQNNLKTYFSNTGAQLWRKVVSMQVLFHRLEEFESRRPVPDVLRLLVLTPTLPCPMKRRELTQNQKVLVRKWLYLQKPTPLAKFFLKRWFFDNCLL